MQKLLAKRHATFAQIMYATRSDRKTVLHMASGETIETFLPIRRLTDEAPADSFVCVNKGVVLAHRFIASIDDNEYTMTDGACFRGRIRQKAAVRAAEGSATGERWAGWERFAILNDLPLAFCVIELVFDRHGHGIDFIFRYCNQEMETLEGKRLDEMVNRSFYEVFDNGDPKWLVTYADVALNGVKRTIDSYSPEINANLRIYCYQPEPNFCACVLLRMPLTK